MPTSEQIEAALPAMREWLCANTAMPAAIPSYTRRGIEWLMDVHYPGGVAQFIAPPPQKKEKNKTKKEGRDA
jgi:hypothetical protein